MRVSFKLRVIAVPGEGEASSLGMKFDKVGDLGSEKEVSKLLRDLETKLGRTFSDVLAEHGFTTFEEEKAKCRSTTQTQPESSGKK